MSLSFLFFIAGTVIGSFLNVCIFRLPRAESVVFPGSHCMACGKPVRWHDNIPVISYFVLRGRCRDCRVRFSAQYVIIEILTGALFVFFYRYFGLTGLGGIYFVFSLALLTQAMIDVRHKIIPDMITLPGLAFGIIASVLFPALHDQIHWREGLMISAAGAFIGGGFLYVVALIAEWALKKEAMGGGDVKLLAMIGAFLGLPGVLWTLFISSLMGSAAGIYFKFVKKQEEIPFGPFLGAAAFLYIFFGRQVIEWYMNLLHSGF